MQNFSDDSVSPIKVVDFGCIPVETVAEKIIAVENSSEKVLSYRVSLMYILNSIDRVFNISITSTPIKPGDSAEVRILFKPHLSGQSYTDYYVIEDTSGSVYRLTIVGRCFGPEVYLSRRKLVFRVCKNVSEHRKAVIKTVNRSAVETTYQWLLPLGGQGYFQEPLFLNALATVVLPGNPLFNINDHVFEKNWKRKSRYTHLMENSLNRLSYIPSASVFERYLDFGMGSVTDITRNISQTLCVTNHEQEEGYIQWMPDPDIIFIIDPIDTVIPPNESKLFTVRFRPKIDNEVYGYLFCGDFQYKKYDSEDSSTVRMKHTWFRIPCIGNTWSHCTEWTTEWDCPNEVVLPPTVPARTTFTNFMLANKLDIPMYFKFEAPYSTNFVVLPMCGIVQSRGWQIISVALEPKSFGDYYETWDLVINKIQKARICLCGNAEISQVEVMSHGYNPATHAMYEFPPTITGCTNYCTAYFHNITRMEIHIRVLNSVPWLGGDSSGSIVLPPKEIVRYHWWFFPNTPNKVYDTTVTCSCICLIDGRPVGEPTELFIHITGFSELPNLRVLPKTMNLHDVVVDESSSFSVTLYNYGSCFFTSRLYYVIDGMGDDFTEDRLQITSTVNSLKPSNHCEVKMSVTPEGAGPRQIDIKYTVLFRSEHDEIKEIQPIMKTICKIWYDGIYPTLKIKRTISVKCPVILSNHCVWNIVNINELNKAFEDCRPNKPLSVNIYAPDLCVRTGLVEFIFVMGCLYAAPVPWSLRREKICDCNMIEVKVGISTYEMRHKCIHRPLVELTPLNGIVTPEIPNLLHLKFNYALEGQNALCYTITLPNKRTIYLYINMYAHLNTRGILTPLRRPVGETDYLAVLDCGRVPINNLDPVIRIVWLYNPTEVFTTWRLLRGNTISPDSVLRCLLYFAEVPPLGKLAIPFAFLPTEMIDYETIFNCSFGYDTVKILVKGQGGLPNCIETRLDIPSYIQKVIRSSFRDDVIYLSMEHMTIPPMPTHSLSRDIIALCNNTDHIMRFIWLPERIANILNIVMTPCWGVIQPKSSEWITMTVYTLQEPATFTTTVACEILDLTERRRFQRNEMLRRSKIEKCNQEFIITEEGTFHPVSSADQLCEECFELVIAELNNEETISEQQLGHNFICVCCGISLSPRTGRNSRPLPEGSAERTYVADTIFPREGINDFPPYVEDIEKPQPYYLSMTVSVSSKGQRDGYPRMLLKQMWEQTPPYDLLSSDLNDYGGGGERTTNGNNMTMADIIRIIDGILWDALHSKMFRNQIEYYAKEEIPTYQQLLKVIETDTKSRLSRRVTSGICDAIVNKAIFHVYSLNPKHEVAIIEAE